MSGADLGRGSLLYEATRTAQVKPEPVRIKVPPRVAGRGLPPERVTAGWWWIDTPLSPVLPARIVVRDGVLVLREDPRASVADRIRAGKLRVLGPCGGFRDPEALELTWAAIERAREAVEAQAQLEPLVKRHAGAILAALDEDAGGTLGRLVDALLSAVEGGAGRRTIRAAIVMVATALDEVPNGPRC
jgi:hypothetical protein